MAGPVIEVRGESFEDLPRLVAGRVRAENALWIENPLDEAVQFLEGRWWWRRSRGPAVITMIHFAMPQT